MKPPYREHKMAKTTFGSIAGSSPTKFGGFASGGGQQEGALKGITKFQGSGGMGISQGGTKAQEAKYSKEYGMRLTDEQVGELDAAESDFQKRLVDYQTEVNKKISEATGAIGEEKSRLSAAAAKGEGEVGKAKGQIKQGWGKWNEAAKQNTVEGLFNHWWKAEKKVPVRVVADGKVQGTYVMPKTAAMKIMEDKGINGGWVDGGKRLNIDVKQQGRIRGQELHDALRVGTSRDNMLSQFAKNEKVYSALAKNRAELSKAASELKNAENQLAKAETQMRSQVAEQKGNIQRAEFDTKQLGKTRDREVKGAKQLSERQKEKRAELYQKWLGARRKAYQVLEKMEMK